jgi:hypothetical protein
MAQLYFNEQLIAKSNVSGILGHHLMDDEIVITYPHKPKKYYTIVMYDDQTIHSLIINVKGDDLETGDIIVDYVPFIPKNIHYEANVLIYEQPKKCPLPLDDFDMEDYIKQHKMTLLYTIDFTILQKLERKPNLFSNHVYRSKLVNVKKNL